MENIRFLFVLITCILFAGCTVVIEPADPITIDTQESYIHEYTGMVFPTEVDTFYRSNVTQYDSKGKDISCSYKLPTPPPLLTISVYVYPAKDLGANGSQDEILSQLEGIAGKITDSLANTYSEFKVLSQERTNITGDGTTHNGIVVWHQYNHDIGFGQHDFLSFLYLFNDSDYLVKYRGTFPVEDKDKAEPLIQDFMNQLDW